MYKFSLIIVPRLMYMEVWKEIVLSNTEYDQYDLQIVSHLPLVISDILPRCMYTSSLRVTHKVLLCPLSLV